VSRHRRLGEDATVIKEVTWMDIHHLKRQGMTTSAIARELGLNRRTVRRALAAKQPAVYAPRAAKPSVLDPFKPYIDGRLAKYDLGPKRLLEEIRGQGYAGGYTIVKDHVARVKDRHRVLAVARFETKPGGQGQVDWADFGRITLDGQERRLYLFVLVLGYSRMRYVEFTLDMKTETLIKCHLNAFQYLGGYPDELLFDNLKQVVLKNGGSHDRHEWNPLFRDFGKHYEFQSRLCRPYRAQTKGKVERSVGYVRRGFFEGRNFTGFQDLNTQALAWCDKVNAQVHATTRQVPRDRLKEEALHLVEEKPSYVIVQSVPRRINRDCYVSYLGNRYSVPWRHAGREAILRLQGGRFDIEVAGRAVATHDIALGRDQTRRVAEHFEGLVVELRKRPAQESRLMAWQPVAVEARSLGEYERVLEEFP